MFPPIVFSDLATSGEVWRTIVNIAQESSNNRKIELLKIQFNKGNTLFKGVMKLVFDGTINFHIKLKTDEWYDLVRAGSDEPFTRTTHQLLMNLADGKYTRKGALYAFRKEAKHLGYDSLRLLVAIINKDLQAGFNASTVNKVWKGLIPAFPYMRCSLPTQVSLETLEWGLGVYAQEKADGMFVNINIDGSNLQLLSRQGTEIPAQALDPNIALLTEILPRGYQCHGEMLCRDPEGRIAPREIGNGIFNSICKGGTMPAGWKVLFRVWDAIPLNAVEPKGRYTEPYDARWKMLKNYIIKASFRLEQANQVHQTMVEPIETRICYTIGEARSFFRHMVACGKEGAILKDRTAIWKDGVSKDQIKLKLNCDCDLRVIGFEEGEGKYAGMLGSLVCESEDRLLQTNVSGFTDAMRRKIWKNKEDFLGSIVTVKFNDIMQKPDEIASLFLPRFVEFRTDKSNADSFQRILDSKQRAIIG